MYFDCCDREPVHIRENRRFLSTWMEFSKNVHVYAYFVKAPSRN